MQTQTRTKYINDVISMYFGEDLVKKPHVPIQSSGWYWADARDNARYTDFAGPFISKTKALSHARLARVLELKRLCNFGNIWPKHQNKQEFLADLQELENKYRQQTY